MKHAKAGKPKKEMLHLGNKNIFMKRLIECVPNFSEGRDPHIIDKIAASISAVDGVKLLDVDPGKATNRTVMTMVGEPERVIEAAFQAIKTAAELIDMTKHTGEHPRMGATDVCPLVPISGVSMDECVQFAYQLGERVGRELGISGYFYESAAKTPQRKNLADIRAGEYEGLAKKITDPAWKPDFGEAVFNAKSGATVIGARNFLVAYNVNLNTTSTRRANAIAFDVREQGRVQTDAQGKNILDANGEPVRIPGTLKSVKAIGWFIEEYGVAQISMNLTDVTITSVHAAFDEVCNKALQRGIRVTGSELVGLIPLQSLLDAGKYFLQKQQRSIGVPESELIKIAVKSLGLDELKPFDPEKKVIEYLIRDEGDKKLVSMSVEKFADETSSESPAPGGGSVSALCGAMGAALATMVANLSSHKRGWDDKWEFYSNWAEKGQTLKNKLIHLVDEDTAAFNKIMAAFQLPNTNDAEKQIRKQAVQDATKYATEIPFLVMQTIFESLEVVEAMATHGMKSSISDIGVGALCAQAGVGGAYLNVKINAAGLEDKAFVTDILTRGQKIYDETELKTKKILDLVNQKIGV
jgi:glutamate formiminotransferase/formiminotetrahydrofolate cyclodeaminase